jgi:hypothetical protein
LPKLPDLSIAMQKSTADVAALHYTFRASLVGAAHRFDLTDDGLAWKIGGKSGLWPYTAVASIRLSFRPVSMQSRRFRADIDHENSARLTVLSTTWQTAALVQPQDNDYRAFIAELHRRLSQAGSRATLIGGLRPNVYRAAVVLLTLVVIAIAGLLVRAIVTGEFAGALFLVGFAALFGWQVGGFVRRNRPQSYSFDTLPKNLLP